MSRMRPTHNQMKFLVDQMANDPQLCSSNFTKTFTHKIAQQRWENIAFKLNSLPGPEKNWQKWKKTWQDTRNSTKTKAAAIKRHLGGTGGGPSCSVELNAIQMETLPLLSKSSISGHSDSVESIVQFDFDGSTEDVIIGKLTHQFILVIVLLKSLDTIVFKLK
ncbi:PREDICTED: uncharacterized protein LOC107172244 [Diuraphis noxia]|uniref:uncharacterized protein LOC107172244 n=1 Tax=Diuraphis noxia TaxID=143948 RepID=UPI00076370D5|nr:PREDICTED: uncharacterized protein LOC107172244 [Diuraphis noxia]